MAKDNKKKVEQITDMEVDFAQWYTDVCKKAELIDYSSIKGMFIYRPYGYAIWENIQKNLDARFKATGHENVAMPVLIPESLLKKEGELVNGFAPEVAWVTAGGETYAWTLGAENSVTGSIYLQVQGQEDTVYLVSVSALSSLESTKIELAAPAPTPEPTEEPASEPEAAAPEEDAETTSSPASDAAPEADTSSSASESAASETAGEESGSSAA